MNPRLRYCLALSVSLAGLAPAWATFRNVSECPFCQDFNTLAASGSAIWKNDMSGETGWFIQSTGSLTGGGNGLTYNADAGATATVGVYSYGTGTGTDRALGAITGGSGAMSVAFGLLLYNNSGAPVTSLGVSYTGEQWRSASTSAQTLQFTYAIAAGTSGKFYNTDGAGATGYLSPGVTSGPDTAGDNKGLNWVSASAGNFTSPNLTGSGAIAGGASTAINFTLTGLSIPAGSSIMLRWLDPSGNTDGLGIDNVCLSIPVPEPSTYMAGGAVLAMIGATAWRRRSQKQA